MKKLMSFLLCMFIAVTLITGGVAFAEDHSDFPSMTPHEQYNYLKTLGSQEEIEEALSLLTGEQLAALDDYRESVETQQPEASPETSGGTESGGQSFADMTPQQQYEYLKTLQSEEEINKALSQLTDDQRAALEAYRLSVETVEPGDGAAADSGISFTDMTPEQQYAYLLTLEDDEVIDDLFASLSEEQYAALMEYAIAVGTEQAGDGEAVPPAINYTHAAPFKKPVDIGVRMMARSLSMQAMDAPGDEDALVLSKVLSGSDGNYMLTIEAYATGDVSITTGEKPVPADIILVLDVSWSMDETMVSGYTAITFSKNSDAYDFAGSNDLFVKDGGQYYPVTISRTKTGGKQYRYNYTYAIGSYVSDDNASGDAPPAWAFYQTSTTAKLAALKSAANSFIDSIELKANSGEGVDHRIAVVSYASSASIRSGNGSANGAFVNVHNNVSGINTLQGSISGLSTSGTTRADLALQKTVDIFQQDTPDTSGLRNRVVVFFTDGTPTSTGTFEPSVANAAISSAKTLKASTSASPAGYGATVYTIGIFGGADPTVPISSASNENKFMHFASSNYPNATSMTSYGSGGNAGYFLSASNTAGLNNIFQSISDNVETGGTTVTLDETSEIKDVIAPYFELPAGTNPSNIHVYTSEVDPVTGQWRPKAAFPDAVVNISADGRTVGVSGFDYHENYYAAIETNGVITGYQGKKVIIEIPVAYEQGSCFGGVLPTNKPISGVYEHEYLIEALPIPTVNIPIVYDFAVLDKPIYLTQSASIADLFTTMPGYVADGTNNAYVQIAYKVKNTGGTVLGTYTIPAGASEGSWDTANLAISGLTANTNFTVSCTVTPIIGSADPLTVEKTAAVYVWKPEVTFCDSVIYLGETADYSSNLVSAVWKNSAAPSHIPSGPAPSLSYVYAPAAAAFTADTHVDAAVKAGGTDITGYTTFVHQACGEPACGYSAALGRFVVHVKTCSLTVKKTGASDSSDTFIFRITGNGITLRISVQGNGSQTITGLPVGSYTVTEESAWSWRYASQSRGITLSGLQPFAEAVISNSLINIQWLGDDAHAVNSFA